MTDLTKVYGSTAVVNGIDLEVSEGELVAFLGPNGAGKTTTIEILEGFRTATSGSVRVLGADPATAGTAWRERIGMVLQESEPIPSLTALETVRMQSNFYAASDRDRPNPEELLELVGLSESAHQRAKKLSGGQKRRLDLASALVGDPDLIFLDEPTTGFDPSARRESWKMVEALRNLNKTVLLTTHYMDEAEHLADRIVVINAGVIVAEGTASELAEQVQAQAEISWRCHPEDVSPLTDASTKSDASIICDVVDGVAYCRLPTADTQQSLVMLLGVADQNSIELRDLQAINPTLEDVFLALIGGDQEPAAK